MWHHFFKIQESLIKLNEYEQLRENNINRNNTFIAALFCNSSPRVVDTPAFSKTTDAITYPQNKTLIGTITSANDEITEVLLSYFLLFYKQ